MQKITLVHYSSRITYLATRETHDINILLGPASVIKPDVLEHFHPNTDAGNVSHAVAWTEHADVPRHHVTTGDMTPTILRLASKNNLLDVYKTKSNIPADEFHQILETTLDELSKNNYDIPQYLGYCDETVKVTSEFEDTPESRALIKDMLKNNHPYFLTEENQTSHVHIKAPGNEITKHLAELIRSDGALVIGPNGNPVDLNDPSVPAEVRKLANLVMKQNPENEKDINMKVKVQETEGSQSPPLPVKDIKLENAGKLRALMINKDYKKAQLKELVQSMGIPKLRRVYPGDEVDELLNHLKIKEPTTDVKN